MCLAKVHGFGKRGATMQLRDFLRPRTASITEVFFLTIALFTLPIFEAPKNIASFGFLCAFLFQSLRFGSFGKSSPFDIPILGLISVLWVAPLFSEYGTMVAPVSYTAGWTMIGLFALCAARLDYHSRHLNVLFSALLLGGAWAVADSLRVWDLKPYPEFRSVGHVNHSSMYSLIPLSVGLATLFARSWPLKFFGLIGILATLVYLPPSRSLVGGIAIFSLFMATIIIWAWVTRAVRPVVVGGFLLAAFATGITFLPAFDGFRSELVMRVSSEELFSGRDKILNTALEVWDRNPIFGTGLRSFEVATAEPVVREEVEADGRDYDAVQSNYWFYNHGHNLWVTILVERGVFGVAMVAWLLFAYFRGFVPIAIDRKLDVVSDTRVAAVAASLVALGFVTAGLGNTTMINEHGQAGMLVIAIAWGFLRGTDALTKK